MKIWAEKGPKVRKLRLQTKLNIMFTLFAAVLGIALFGFSEIVVILTATRFYGNKAKGAAYITANYLQNSYANEIEGMVRDEDYEHMVQRVTMFKQALGIHDILVLIPGEDSISVYLAVQNDDDEPLKFGYEITYTEEDREEFLPVVEEGVASSEPVLNGHSNHYDDKSEISMLAPVRNDEGDVIAVVEADIRIDDIADVLVSYTLQMFAVYLVIVLVFRWIQLRLSKRMIIDPLKKITARASSFVAGDRLAGFENDIKSGDEMQVLNETLGRMTQEIADYTDRKAENAANSERDAAERKVAARMQRGMLPEYPEDFLKQYDIWLKGCFIPSQQVQGDAYDYFVLNDDRLAIVMYSIRVVGLAASVQLLVARAIIRSQLLSGHDLSKAVTEINRQLYEQLPQHDVPLRVFVGVLDGKNHTLTYINADNNAPVLMRRGQSYSFLPCPSYAPLGQVENVSYQERTVEFHEGDRMLWYSDELPALPGENGEPLGLDGLLRVLNDDRIPEPEKLMRKLEQYGPETARVFLLLECRKVDQKRGQLRVEPRAENTEMVREFIRRRMEDQPLLGRDKAQLLVCAEEYFSVCCRYVQRGMVELSCLPEEDRFTLRFAADMNGLDPFEHDAGEMMGNVVEFIHKYADAADSRVVKGCTIVTMSKKYKGTPMEE